jgi:hypothetical protein
MRWLAFLFVAGCSFNVRPASDGGPSDGARDDGVITDDALIDTSTPAVITFIQGNAASGSMGQVATMLSQPILDGDLCVLGVGTQGGSIASVSDTGGNTFTGVGTNGGQTVYVAANMHAAANDRITVTFNGTTGFTLAVAIYRGLATTSPVDATVSDAGTGLTFDSGAAATTKPHALLVGVAASNGVMAAGSGYTTRSGGTYSLIEDREVTTTGSYHATVNAVSNQTWTLRLLALEAND